MIPLLTPWLIRLALALACVGTGAYFGYTYADNACQAVQSEAKTVAIEQHNEAATIGQTVERETVQRAVKTEAVFNGLSMKVITYAQNHPAGTGTAPNTGTARRAPTCFLDADGLRLWSAANANTDFDPAAERDATLSGSAPADQRRDDGLAGQSRPDGQGLSPVPRPAPGAGAVAGEDRP